MEMRCGHFVGPVGTGRPSVEQIDGEVSRQGLQRRPLRSVETRWFVEVTQDDPVCSIWVREPCLQDLPDSLSLSLPDDMRLVRIGIGCLEMAYEERDRLECDLEAVSAKDRVLAKIRREVGQT